MPPVVGTFPFGSPLRSLTQEERSPKRVFVLGVYASAVHAQWFGSNGRLLVRALAVASEPVIFWNGSGAEPVVRGIKLPDGVGRLKPAATKFNGPSGRSIDEDFLGPLRLDRSAAWLCDLVPHTCMNPKQQAAIDRAYKPMAKARSLPAVDLPQVPKVFATDARRAGILAELELAQAEVIVLLGDQPIRHWLRFFDRRWTRLSDFGEAQPSYGRLHAATISGKPYHLLPLAHPRQVGGLGSHSQKWRDLHAGWKRSVAGQLLR